MTEPKGVAGPFRRIILAIDASEASAKAVSFVLNNFQPDRSTGKSGRVPLHVSVMHVMARRPPAPIEFKFSAPWIKSEEKAKDAARRLADKGAQELTKAGFMTESVFRIGNPAAEILGAAKEKKADLIVMGAKGLGTIDKVLLGSVSMQVLQYANCPVLVVR